jgi:WD40 repeat protein
MSPPQKLRGLDSRSHFLFLPVELLVFIFGSLLDPCDIRNLALVGNSLLLKLSRDDRVWKSQIEKRDRIILKEGENWKERFRTTWWKKFQCKETFKSSSGSVSCLVNLGEGLFASATSDKTIMIWDISKLFFLTLKGHANQVYCLTKFQNNFLVSGSFRTLAFWNFRTGNCIGFISKAHVDRVFSVCSIQGKIVSSSYEEMKVWNPYTSECLHTLEAKGILSFLEFKGNLFCGDRANLHLRDGKTFEILKRFEGHTSDILSLTILNGKLVSSGWTSKEMLKIWNIETTECEKTLFPHDNRINYLVVSMLNIWNIKTTEREKNLFPHDNRINSLVVSSDEKLITCSNDRKIKVLDPLRNFKCIKTFEYHTDYVSSVIFTEGLLISSADKTIKIWGPR